MNIIHPMLQTHPSLSRTDCQSSNDNPHRSSHDTSSSPGAHSGSSIHSYCVPWDARAGQATQLGLQALQGTLPLIARHCTISTSQCQICLLVSLSHGRVDRPESSRRSPASRGHDAILRILQHHQDDVGNGRCRWTSSGWGLLQVGVLWSKARGALL